MLTLTKLNEKVWYRFLKVIYILFYLPYFFLLFLVIHDSGKEFHLPILPDSVKEVLKDPEFYKLDDYEKKEVILLIEIKSIESKMKIKDDMNNKLVPFYDLSDADQMKIVKGLIKQPIPTIPLQKKYEYKSFYTWNILNCIIYGIVVTICYIFVMECIRRGFYYVVIGKVFPNE